MLISIPEIAQELGVAESTVRRWCERGEGPRHTARSVKDDTTSSTPKMLLNGIDRSGTLGTSSLRSDKAKRKTRASGADVESPNYVT
jgi:hypothetical protein